MADEKKLGNQEKTPVGAIPWLDLTISTPSIGVRWTTTVRHWTDYLQVLKPTIEDWRKRGVVTSLAGLPGDPLGTSMSTDDGFSMLLQPTGVVVEFKYNVGIEEPGDKIATVKIGEVERFSELLKKSVTRFTEVLRPLVGLEKGGVAVDRFGVVARCRFKTASAPPGIRQSMKTHGPYAGAILGYEGTTLALTGRARVGDPQWDQCHHFMKYGDESQEVVLRLDWQRNFRPAMSRDVAGVEAGMSEAITEANGYFDRFGLGV